MVCAEPYRREVPAEGMLTPCIEPLAQESGVAAVLLRNHLKCIWISISVSHLLAAKLEHFLFFLLL